jgi:hypothetical protein
VVFQFLFLLLLDRLRLVPVPVLPAALLVVLAVDSVMVMELASKTVEELLALGR